MSRFKVGDWVSFNDAIGKFGKVSAINVGADGSWIGVKWNGQYSSLLKPSDVTLVPDSVPSTMEVVVQSFVARIEGLEREIAALRADAQIAGAVSRIARGDFDNVPDDPEV